MFSITTAPAKQSVSETISVLSGRLSSSSLLEDRRAAILGLRSFAKEYPASVASGALRSLIDSLRNDVEDVDTVKVVLETLLMLFSIQDSLEPAEDIALWIADEFTQRRENVTLLLDLLEKPDFYSRLYSLQLLSRIREARPELAEEGVLAAPLGIPRLVTVLDDRRDAVRNEAISLLTFLTPGSIEIQNLVVFENGFGRIFTIIQSEGPITEGGPIVEDCLVLLAFLLRANSVNQTNFRDTDFVIPLADLLKSTYAAKAEEDDGEVAAWAQRQSNRNVYALLAVLRVFLKPGTPNLEENQKTFQRHSILYHALQLAFSHRFEMQIKAEALMACADAIRKNDKLQENFAQLMVPSPLLVPDADGPPMGPGKEPNGVATVYVIDGLLDMALGVHTLQPFDIRMAACECLKAYFCHHPQVRLHFLRRAIEGHQSDGEELANVLTTLLRPLPNLVVVDPYRYWFAAVITFHLLFGDATAKELARTVTEGDAESGEEVVTSIQTVAAHLISGLGRGEDVRVTVGYLMLLLGWLFEDFDAVDDFLGEGSNIQALIQAVLQNRGSNDIVQGLCAMLLGVVYEFSTKDSPIPRGTLQPILVTRMGRDRYMDKIDKLGDHPLMKEFHWIPQRLDPSSDQKLPDVYFDTGFVDFFKQNFTRMRSALDKDAGMEISVVTNGVQKGISRELVDSLRAQNDEKDSLLRDRDAAITSLESHLGQEQADHRRTKETYARDLERSKAANDSLQKSHDQDIRKLQRDHEERMSQLQNRQVQEVGKVQQRHEQEIAKLQRLHKAQADELARQVEQIRKAAEGEAEGLRRQVEYVRKSAEAETQRVQRRAEAESADQKATISRLEVDVMKARKSHAQEMQALREQLQDKVKEQAQRATDQAREAAAAEERCRELERRREAESRDAESQRRDLDERFKAATNEANSKVKAAQEKREATQSELDDLLMVFSDLEEKVSKYRERLKALGEAVSDAEDEDEDEDEDDEDEDEDEDEEEDGVD